MKEFFVETVKIMKWIIIAFFKQVKIIFQDKYYR